MRFGWLQAAEFLAGLLVLGLGAERWKVRDFCSRSLVWLEAKAGPLAAVEQGMESADLEVVARCREVVRAWFDAGPAVLPGIGHLPPSRLREEKVRWYQALAGLHTPDGGARVYLDKEERAARECDATRMLITDLAERGRAREARSLVRAMWRNKGKGK